MLYGGYQSPPNKTNRPRSKLSGSSSRAKSQHSEHSNSRFPAIGRSSSALGLGLGAGGLAPNDSISSFSDPAQGGGNRQMARSQSALALSVIRPTRQKREKKQHGSPGASGHRRGSRDRRSSGGGGGGSSDRSNSSRVQSRLTVNTSVHSTSGSPAQLKATRLSNLYQPKRLKNFAFDDYERARMTESELTAAEALELAMGL